MEAASASTTSRGPPTPGTYRRGGVSVIDNMGVRQAMAVGASRYDEALRELSLYGRAGFTQTGGGCAALEVVLERGYLLVTDADEELPWEPDRLRGWGIGFYWTHDVCEGPEVFVAEEDPSPRVLGGLVEQCLREVANMVARR